MVLFNHHIFSFKTFNAFSPQEARADKIRRMNEFIRKHGYNRSRLEKAGFGDDCLGEVREYHTNDSGWESFRYVRTEKSRFVKEHEGE